MNKTMMIAAAAIASTASAADPSGMVPTGAEIWLDSPVELKNSPVIDTWNPTAGPYSAANAGPAPEFVMGSAGSASAAPAALGSSWGDLIFKGNNSTTISSDLDCDLFKLENRYRMTISGDVTIHTDDLVIENNTRIDLADGASLTIYVSGNVSIRNHVHVNMNTWDPTRVTIVATGSGELSMRNNSHFCGSFVAPDATVKLENNADVYGWVVADTLAMDHPSGLHIPAAPQSITMPAATGLRD